MDKGSVQDSLPNARLPNRFARAATAIGILVVLVGAGHLVAWFSGYMAHQGFSAITMKTNTALSLLLAGLGLVLLVPSEAGSARRWTGRGLAALAALIGLLSLSENVFGWNLGIDQLLAQEPPGAMGAGAPNLMGTPAATGILLTGLAILLLSRRDGRGARAVQGLALAVCLIALLGTIGFLYGVHSLYAIVRVTGVAWLTAVSLLLLGLGLLASRPRQGIIAQVTAEDPGGALLRRVLPLLLLPVVLGWLRLAGERSGMFDAVTGTALMMMIFIVALAVMGYIASLRVSHSSVALRRQREWLRVTLTSIGDAILATDTAGKITFLNPVAEALTGCKEQEALGRPVQEVFRIINEQTRRQADDIVARVLREGSVVTLANHTAIQSRDGREIPIEDSAAPIKDADGKTTGVVLVFHDVTQKRRAQESLRESEGRLVFALETTKTGAWDLDLVDHTAHRSLVHDRIFGYTSLLPQWTYEMFLEHVLPEDREEVSKKFSHAVQTKTDWDFECRIRRTDGENRWIWAAGRHRSDASGKIRRMGDAVHDITERKRAEQALAESRERLDLALSSARMATFDWDIVKDKRTWSDALHRLLGTRPETFTGIAEEFFRVIHPEDRGAVQAALTKALEPNATYETEYRAVWPDASIRHIAARGMVHRDHAGRPVRMTGICWDITDRKRAEEALREAKGQLEFRVEERTARLTEALQALRQTSAYTRSLIEASLDPLVTIGPNGTITDVNAATEAATGLTRQELIGTDFSTYFTEPDKARTGYQQVFKKGAVRDYPLEIRHIDGHTTPVLYNATLYRDDDGQIVGIFAAARDITDLKRAEDSLLESEVRYRTLFEKMDEGFCVAEMIYDAKGRPIDYRFVEINPTFEKHTGFQNALGKTIRELVPDHDQHWFEIYGRVARTGESNRFENIAKAMGRFYDVFAFPVGDAEHRMVGILFKDITEQRRAETALREAHDMLEHRVAERTAELTRSNRELEQFAYVSAHDLQEPLRQVRAYVSMLKERHSDKFEGKAARYFDFVYDGAARMSDLVSGLLEYSRIGARERRREAVSCNAAFEAGLANLKVSVREAHAQITRDDLPTVAADPTQLTQLFQNLVGNAIKFRRDGVRPEIHVGCRHEGNARVLYVRDNGIGIDPEHHEKVFQIFQRLHGRDKFAGTGIGLAICKKIVEQHGGRIWIESRPGDGSTFCFTLPEDHA